MCRKARRTRLARVAAGPLRFAAIVDSLTVAVLVFRNYQLVYSNAATQQLGERLRAKYRSELTVLLRDHLVGLGEKLDRATTVRLPVGPMTYWGQVTYWGQTPGAPGSERGLTPIPLK